MGEGWENLWAMVLFYQPNNNTIHELRHCDGIGKIYLMLLEYIYKYLSMRDKSQA